MSYFSLLMLSTLLFQRRSTFLVALAGVVQFRCRDCLSRPESILFGGHGPDCVDSGSNSDRAMAAVEGSANPAVLLVALLAQRSAIGSVMVATASSRLVLAELGLADSVVLQDRSKASDPCPRKVRRARESLAAARELLRLRFR